MRLIIGEATCPNGSKVFSTLSIFAGIVKNRSRVEQLCYPPQATNESVNVEVHWANVQATSQAEPTTQVGALPNLLRSSPQHDQWFDLLRRLPSHRVRYQGWWPEPALGVAELRQGQWNIDGAFSDMVVDFLNSTHGKQSYLDMSTEPAWLFKGGNLSYANMSDPRQSVVAPPYGTDAKGLPLRQLVDPSGEQLAAYYARMASWFAKGGFTDEDGVEHHSGLSFDLYGWEVLNEWTAEHTLDVKTYTTICECSDPHLCRCLSSDPRPCCSDDAVVRRLRPILPTTRFIGMVLGTPWLSVAWNASVVAEQLLPMYEYFLTPAHHSGPETAKVDVVSLHFCASTSTRLWLLILYFNKLEVAAHSLTPSLAPSFALQTPQRWAAFPTMPGRRTQGRTRRCSSKAQCFCRCSSSWMR